MKIFFKVVLICALATVSLSSVAQVTMNIDATHRGPIVSDHQYGLFFEEINHAGDGGLYAEMIRNRSFEDSSSNVDDWSAISPTNVTATIGLSKKNLLNSSQSQALSLYISNATEANKGGVLNDGFWGMNFKKDSVYSFSVFVRANSSFSNNIYVQLRDASGNAVSEQTKLEGKLSISSWTKLTCRVKAISDCSDGRLAVLSSANGYMYLDVASLFPYTWKGRNNGCRADLAQLLYETKPTFLRFPGGCYVEGQDSYDNAFQWKKTIGPIENRPGHWNNNWGYRSSDGLGFDEYLQLCEDLNASPMFVVNIGLGHGFTISLNDVDSLITNTLDAIEYANGDVCTEWGALRAKNGHAQPYNIKYIEIGNENYSAGDDSEYGKRYNLFYNAIHEKYPELTIIGNVEAWGTDNPSWANSYPVDMVDEHYYRSSEWMINNYNKYDSYPRTIAVYNGEYAANSGSYGKYGNLNSALGEAVYMMGMERNSDVCKLASFAPIFTHEQNPKWAYDMIHFNCSSVFCTPSYYVQKLMSNNIGGQNLLWTETGNEQSSCDGYVGLGSWNTSVSYDDVSVTDNSGNSLINDDFSSSNSDWNVKGGAWTVSDGVLNESDIAQNCVNMYNKVVPTSKYIYKLRARKNSGNEGFLVVFNYKDADNYCWWNIGGWNNSKNGVEMCANGSKSTIVSSTGSITSNQWYDIEIDVCGNDVTCMLDGTEIHHFTLPEKKRLYQSAQLDEDKGLMYLKVVNPTSTASSLKLNLSNFKATSATVIRLASVNGTDENTMDIPNNIVPTEEENVFDVTSLDIPAYSLNIFKIKVDNVSAEVDDNNYTKEDIDKYGYLYAHMNSSREITNYALSHYGIMYNDLLSSGEVFDTKTFTTTGGMRDAYVCRTNNGKFMLAETDMTSSLGWNSNHIMVFMLSNDLFHWDKKISIDLESPENLAALGVSSADDITAAWAPEIIYDPVTEKYVVYYSVGFKDRHRIYYSLMNEDLTGFTTPKLYFDPSYDIIDADIVYNEIDKKYVMLYKHEDGQHYLLQATADKLVPDAGATGTCQWIINSDFQVSEDGKSIEAPSLFRPINCKTWKLAYMNYSGGGYKMLDLDEHCLNPSNLVNMKGNVEAQHGSFVKLTEAEYVNLQTWEKVKQLLSKSVSYNKANPYQPLADAIEKADDALKTTGTFTEECQNMADAYNALKTALNDYDKYLKKLAEESKLQDITFMLVNPDFSEGSTGWSGTSFTTAASGVAEQYNTTFDFYQKLSEMKAGVYRLVVQCFYRAGSSSVAYHSHKSGTEVINPCLYINDSEEKTKSLYSSLLYTYSPYTFADNVYTANSAFNVDKQYMDTLDYTLSVDGTLKIGIKSDTSINSDWCCFDNFQLFYLGDLTGIKNIPVKNTCEGKMYNLQGCCIMCAPDNTIYIKNRKKCVK